MRKELSNKNIIHTAHVEITTVNNLFIQLSFFAQVIRNITNKIKASKRAIKESIQ